MKFRFLNALATFLACGSLVACAGFPAWLRQYTYPPDFEYITQEQLRSTMWQLAREVHELQLLMLEPTSTNERQRKKVVELLMTMEHTTSQLNRSGRPSNHPVIDHNLDALRRDIVLARVSVEKNPPNYFLVGSVTGACVYCHRGNPGKLSWSLPSEFCVSRPIRPLIPVGESRSDQDLWSKLDLGNCAKTNPPSRRCGESIG